jgi:hypothetical protein
MKNSTFSILNSQFQDEGHDRTREQNQQECDRRTRWNWDSRHDVLNPEGDRRGQSHDLEHHHPILTQGNLAIGVGLI